MVGSGFRGGLRNLLNFAENNFSILSYFNAEFCYKFIVTFINMLSNLMKSSRLPALRKNLGSSCDIV